MIFTANLLGESLRVGVSVGTELGKVLHEAFECDGGHILGNFDGRTPFAFGWQDLLMVERKIAVVFQPDLQVALCSPSLQSHVDLDNNRSLKYARKPSTF